MSTTNGVFKTNDDVRLAFRTAGTGPPLLLVPGWTLTAALFDRQLEGLSEQFQVVALDPRGHGDSESPEHGYRMHRHAMDVRQLIEHLGFETAHVVGHSMGCCVLWAYLDLFGSDGLNRLVFVDMVPHPFANPAHTEDEIARFGSTLPPAAAMDIVNELTAGRGEAVLENFVAQMTTESAGAVLRARVLSEAIRMRGAAAAREFLSDIFNDWRDILPRIDRPALYVAGEGSFLPASSVEWCASQTPGARFEKIPAQEGGSHLLHLEASEAFNRLLIDFLLG